MANDSRHAYLENFQNEILFEGETDKICMPKVSFDNE